MSITRVSRVRARRASQLGMSLIEVLVVVAVVGVVLVPVMAWSVTALTSSAVNSEVNRVTTSLTAFKSRFDRDVAASYSAVRLPGTVDRCASVAGSVLDASAGTLQSETTLISLWLDRTQPRMVSYVEYQLLRTDPGGSTSTVYSTARVECALDLQSNGSLAVGALVDSVLLIDGVSERADLVCATRDQYRSAIGSNGQLADECGVITLTVGHRTSPTATPQLVTVRSVRRVDPVPQPQRGRRPTPVLVCTPTCPATINRNTSVRFDAGLSSDPDPGGIEGYIWDFGDGTPRVQGAVVTHTYGPTTTLGTKTVTLTVFNGSGASSTLDTTITVVNAAPVVVASPNPVNTFRRVPINFDASSSYDPDAAPGDALAIAWNFGDGTTTTGATPAPKQYLNTGTFLVTVTATDADGAARSTTISVTVANKPPEAKLSLCTGSGAACATGVWSVPPLCNANDATLGLCQRVNPEDFPFQMTFSGIRPDNLSNDVDGFIPTGGYLWDVQRTTDGVQIASSGSPTFTYTFSQSGRYRVTLQVTDNDGDRSTISAEVTINRPPVVSIQVTGSGGGGGGAGRCVLNDPPYTCSFDGSASTDPDGTVVAWDWDFGDGTTESGAIVTKTWDPRPAFGTFPVTLTVTDDEGETRSASVNVKVNRKPAAQIGPQVIQLYRNLPFTFAGTGSDLDGTIASWDWTFTGGGPTVTATGQTPTVTLTGLLGPRTVTLTVTDDDGGVTTVTRTITVLNQAPIAFPEGIGRHFSSTATGPYLVTLNGDTLSYDPDGTIVNYEWRINGVVHASSAGAGQLDYPFPNFGTYSVTLIVTDNDGSVGSTTIPLVVNRNPIAAFTTLPNPAFSLTAPLVVQFNAAASTDLDGNIIQYFWDFGDGTSAQTANSTIQRTYTTPGRYTVTLRVLDNEGGETILTRTDLVVINRLPIAVITPTPTLPATSFVLNTNPGTMTFNGGDSSDPDGTIVAYNWNFGDGTTSTAVSPTKTWTNFGTFLVRLTVTDNSGSTATTTVNVKINRPPNAVINNPTPLNAGVGVAFPFSSATSGDPDGVVVGYAWDFGDGTTSALPNPPKTYAANGTYTVSLVVTDNDGRVSAPATRTINVSNAPPIARIVTTPALTFPGRVPPELVSATAPFTVTLNGSTSSDPNGTVTNWAWDFGDGTTGTGAVQSKTYAAFGTYNVVLTVTDNDGFTGTTTIRVRVNQAPVAVITTDPTPPTAAAGPFTVTFTSTNSVDPEGGPLTCIWDQVAPPPSQSSFACTSVRTFTAPGLYTIRLRVFDDAGLQGAATVQVRVNRPPVANFTMTPTSGLVNTNPGTVTFNGGPPNSSDPDGTIVTYAWDFGDGTTGTGATPSKTYSTFGTFNVTLTVTDNDGISTTSAPRQVKVNRPPVPDIGPSTLNPKRNRPFQFTGAGSSDPDGTVASYAWNFGDGTTATGVAPSKTYTTLGTYTVTLTVTDNNGLAASTTRTATVTDNQLPTAVFTRTPAYADLVPAAITFDASGSSDPDGTISSYSWNFGDGTTGTGVTPPKSYTTYGTFVVTLTVTDNNGDTASTSLSVRVNRRPSAVISMTPTVRNALPYDFSLGALSSVDLDGSIVSYAWDFGDGTTATGSTATKTYSTFGAYTVTLTVTDNEGGVTVATAVAKVNRTPIAQATFAPNPAQRAAPVQFTSTSSDPDGTISALQWDFGDGNFGGGVNPIHVYSASGTYTVTLIVADNDGATATTQFPVTVVNQPPKARITTTPNPPVIDLGTNVTFRGTTSSDDDGTILSYAWDFGNGTTGTGATPPAVTYNSYGFFQAQLTVTDNDGATNVATVIVKVNRPPTAVIGSTTGITRGIPFTFSSAGSGDTDGTVAGYFWDFGDGTLSALPNPTHTYQGYTNHPVSFTVTLSVTDNDGRTSTATRTVTPANQPPVAKASAQRVNLAGTPIGVPSGPAPLRVQFSASDVTGPSNDPDGTIIGYSWDFGDGTTSTQPNPLKVYTGAPGNRTAVLTVTDNNGGTGTKSIVVTVNANQLPVPSFTVTQNVGGQTYNVAVNAAASSDPDGEIVSYAWNFDTVTNSMPAPPNGIIATTTYPNNGQFTIRLTVTDNSGATASTTRNVYFPGSPPPPTGLTHNGGGNFSWNPVPGATRYQVWREGGTIFCDPNAYATANAPATSVSVGGCWISGNYTMRVLAAGPGPGDFGNWSNPIPASW